MKILITGGGTTERVDAVRYVGNISTGRTASRIADWLSEKGHEIIYLRGQNSEIPRGRKIKIINYNDFKNLWEKIKKILSSQDVDILVQAAAVADYSPSRIMAGNLKIKPSGKTKIPSSLNSLTVSFRKNFKILDRIKNISKNKRIFVFGFKLTCNADRKERRHAAFQVKADAVALNDLSEIKKEHPFHIYMKKRKTTYVPNAEKLAERIEKIAKKATTR